MTQLMQSDLICGMFESLEKLTGAEENADTSCVFWDAMVARSAYKYI